MNQGEQCSRHIGSLRQYVGWLGIPKELRVIPPDQPVLGLRGNKIHSHSRSGHWVSSSQGQGRVTVQVISLVTYVLKPQLFQLGPELDTFADGHGAGNSGRQSSWPRLSVALSYVAAFPRALPRHATPRVQVNRRGF